MLAMNNEKKLMIVNGWSDMNRGDSAIVLGMIRLLRKHFPHNPIYLMSEFSESDPRFDSGYWAIASSYPGIPVLPALFPYPTGRSKARKIINAAITLAVSWTVLAFPAIGRYLYRGAQAGTWRKITESDVLISKGGHIFYISRCSLQELYSLFKHAFPLLLGKRLRKKTVLYAQSIGPFSGRLCRAIAKSLFNQIDSISVRESVSLDVLRDLGITSAVHIVPDAAFLLSGKSQVNNTIHNKDNVIITPRQWNFGNREAFEHYIKSLAFLAEWLSAKGYKILLVSHTTGPTASEDDRVAVRYLYEAIKTKENVQTINASDLTAFDLIDLYASARLLIGTRFHSVIFALLSGTPVIAISYFGPKTYGIMESMSMGQFVFDINRLDVTKIMSTILYILENHKTIRQKILDRVNLQRVTAEKRGIALINSVLKGGQ